MVTERCDVFETNSSSVHTMVIATDKELELFKAGKLFVSSLPGFSDNNTDGTATLIKMDEVYKKYCESDEEYDTLPKLSKSSLKELMLDPPTYDDFEYVDKDRREMAHQHWDGIWSNSAVNWDYSKHGYSKKTLKELENYHGKGLFYLLYSNSFPHSYNMLCKRTDKKERSERKLNVLKFEIWD